MREAIGRTMWRALRMAVMTIVGAVMRTMVWIVMRTIVRSMRRGAMRRRAMGLIVRVGRRTPAERRWVAEVGMMRMSSILGMVTVMALSELRVLVFREWITVSERRRSMGMIAVSVVPPPRAWWWRWWPVRTRAKISSERPCCNLHFVEDSLHDTPE